MGARGPGARKKNKNADEKAKSKKNHPWNKKGLTRAEKVIAFCESLPITAGLLCGKKMKLLQFQKEFIKSVYVTDDSGCRQIRQATLSTPRKQGKTGLTAALALCHTLGPESEPRGQCYSCANDRAQASILFREMKAIILQTPWMDARVTIRDVQKEIEDLETGSTFQALSADASTKMGLSPSFVCYDELGSAKTRDLFDAMASSQGARREPLMIVISTQASDNDHPMSNLVDYGLKVQAGEVEDKTFHLTLFAAPDDADPWNPATWKACNPAMGIYMSEADIASAALRAQKLPGQEPAFRNLRLNQRYEQDARFITRALWEPCAGEVDLESLRGCRCYGGLDLSSTTDLSAMVLYFPDSGAVLSWFWLPDDNLQDREMKDQSPYRLWKKQGFLQTHPGKAVDRYAIALQMAEVASRYDVQGIAFDRWRFEDLNKILMDEGISVPMVPWGQGYRDFSPAVSELETLLLNEKLRHGGHPVLRMNAGNAVILTDPAGNRKIDKKRSRGRVDGIVCLSMAVGLAARMRIEKPFDASQVMCLNF